MRGGKEKLDKLQAQQQRAVNYLNHGLAAQKAQALADPNTRWGYQNDPKYRASVDAWEANERRLAQEHIARLQRAMADIAADLNRMQQPGAPDGTHRGSIPILAENLLPTPGPAPPTRQPASTPQGGAPALARGLLGVEMDSHR